MVCSCKMLHEKPDLWCLLWCDYCHESCRMYMYLAHIVKIVLCISYAWLNWWDFISVDHGTVMSSTKVMGHPDQNKLECKRLGQLCFTLQTLHIRGEGESSVVLTGIHIPFHFVKEIVTNYYFPPPLNYLLHTYTHAKVHWAFHHSKSQTLVCSSTVGARSPQIELTCYLWIVIMFVLWI